VEDVRDNGVQQPAPPIVYWPSFGESLYRPGAVNVERGVAYAIRSNRAGDQVFLNQISRAVWSIDASLPVASVQTMQELYNRSMARASFALVMLGIAGAMALLLGIIGIYGVISYIVSQRQREIGIRLALGARQVDLKRMFVRYGLKLAGAGVVIGCAAAMGLTRVLRNLLFGVSPLDPVTYVLAPLVLIAAAVCASYLPARRAAAVDPSRSLRSE
jgi:ABC-type antimicrobial peptide transport system permease subunit